MCLCDVLARFGDGPDGRGACGRAWVWHGVVDDGRGHKSCVLMKVGVATRM